MCYKFDHSQLDLERFGICEEPDGHRTLFPISDILNFEYLQNSKDWYVEELSQRGWSPHCIQLHAAAEPSTFTSTYEREIWNFCRVVFRHIYIVDHMLLLLVEMERHEYKLTEFGFFLIYEMASCVVFVT